MSSNIDITLPPTNFSLAQNENVTTNASDFGYDEDSGCCVTGSERIFVPIIFSIIVILGCLGNILVVVVVIKNRAHHKNTTNLFILNLAVADILFLVFCVPFHAIIYTYAWPFGEFMCKSVHFVQYSSMVASIFTLVAMALDRYLAVSFPLRTKHMRTPTTAFVTSVVIWILSIAMAVPWPIFYTVREYSNDGPDPITVCADDWGASKPHRSTYFLVLFVLCYVIPLISIFILSALMIRQLWLVGSDAHYREGSLRAKRKVTRLVIVVVIVFSICWLPSHVMWLWTSFFVHTIRRTYTFYYFKISAHVLSYANSCMNPVIYAFLSTQFRKGFHRALRMNCSKVRCHRTNHNGENFKSISYTMTPSGTEHRQTCSVGSTTL